ncbi:hypothetical protein BGZ60DRAFT_227711 [Tricladium varicosporioides]|nr:hypothetical protein BGZ60DRAFT_227711 [Hymenoscyphus varicosporioides]
MDSSREHIIVGVDIGYTYTGVAIGSTLTFDPEKGIQPVPIQRWPGESAIRNKVPTSLTYKGGDRRVRSWGFSCPRVSKKSQEESIKVFFKFLLEQSCLDELNSDKKDPRDQEVMSNVHTWFVDYLTQIYTHIMGHFAEKEVDFSSTAIEYIFSLPTAWRENQELISTFEKLIGQAGFGLRKNCTLRVDMTEAVASAVYTAGTVKHKFEMGDAIIVCDAGGGTTDICVLKVGEVDNRVVELEILGSPISIHVGSVNIDHAFKVAFQAKLNEFIETTPILPKDFTASEYAADEATHDTKETAFQVIKHNWGRKNTSMLEFCSFGVLEESKTTGSKENMSDDMIEDPRVKIKICSADINKMFDDQITEIKNILDKTLENTPEKVTNLILTGGLGSSQYVQSKLAAHLKARGIRIMVDPKDDEAPLSVCKGLVYDRMQRLIYGHSVIRTRRCRASYGILYNKIYNKYEHQDRESFTDSVDGRKYVENEVDWFLKKGQEIQEDTPIKFTRTHHISPKNPDNTWRITFVTSILPLELLLHHFDNHYVQPIRECVSTFELSSLTPRRRIPVIGKRFLQGKYEVEVTVDEDNLKIQIKVDGDLKGEFQVDNVLWPKK